MWVIIIGAVPITGFAANEPHEAILSAVQAFKNNDIRGLVMGSVGEEEFNKLASEWTEERENRLAEITDEDRAEFAAQMGLLTADGAEETIMAMLSPQLVLFKEQATQFMPMIQGLGAMQIEQIEGATDEDSQKLNQVLQAFVDWAKNVDIASEELARQAVGVAAQTARDLDVATLDDLASLEFDDMVGKGEAVLIGAREILSIYGLSLDESLDSFQAETIANDGTTATVKSSFTIFGAPMDVETEYVLIDDKWLSKDAIEQSQKMAELSAATAADPAEAEMPEAATEGVSDDSAAAILAEPLPAGSNGYFRMGDVRIDLHHVYAFLAEDNRNPGTFETIVILADRELNPDAMGENFDPLDGALQQISEQGGIVRIVVGSDGDERGLYFQNTEPSESFNTAGSGDFTVTENSRDRIEGRWALTEPEEFFDKTYEFSLIFAADVSDALLRGDPLPAGGGEAGEAYLGKMQALVDGNVAVLREMLGEFAEWRLPQSASEEEIADSIESMRWGWPVEATITGGLDRGDVAVLRVVGTDVEGKTLNGRVMMEKTEQGWQEGAIDLDTLYSTDLNELLAAATEAMVEPTVADEPDPSEIVEDAAVKNNGAAVPETTDTIEMVENQVEVLQSSLDGNPFLKRYKLGLTVTELVDGFTTIELTSASDALIQQARSGIDLLSVDVSTLDSDQDRLAVTALRRTLESVARKNNLEAILLVAPPISGEEQSRIAADEAAVAASAALAEATEAMAKSEQEAKAKKEIEDAARVERRKEMVRQIQIELANLGYAPGPADGIAGRGTRGAIEDYQGAAGLHVDGISSDELLVHLQSSDAVSKESGAESEGQMDGTEMEVKLDETEYEKPAKESVDEQAEEPKKKSTVKGLLKKLFKRKNNNDDIDNEESRN